MSHQAAPLKLLLTGGGTGGHIYPALAVGKYFLQCNAQNQLVYVGRPNSLEEKLVSQEHIDFHGIEFSGMPRGLTLNLPIRMLKWLMQLNRAKQQAIKILRHEKPSLVFGTGGYITAPVLMAAKALNIPYCIHEPDAQPGLANRFLGRNAALITTSFAHAASQLKYRPDQQILVTGNPLRGKVGQMTPTYARQQLSFHCPEDAQILLVTGGSQGARRINEAVIHCAKPLLNEIERLFIVHVTGEKRYDESVALLKSHYPELLNHDHYKLLPYTNEMPALLELSSLAVCRAGSLTLSEMFLCAVPTILVPYPHAAADHQHMNSQAAVDAGASIMIPDHQLSPVYLQEQVLSLLNTPTRLTQMAESAKKLAKPNATKAIVEALRKTIDVQ
ncbi:MAG: undecaprenyldiphospho-muramoylpentapeptide beta-N-acetylglucosaminyltransferase [Cyanobacteria bacterium P01_H01_bin.74]